MLHQRLHFDVCLQVLESVLRREEADHWFCAETLQSSLDTSSFQMDWRKVEPCWNVRFLYFNNSSRLKSVFTVLISSPVPSSSHVAVTKLQAAGGSRLEFTCGRCRVLLLGGRGSPDVKHGDTWRDKESSNSVYSVNVETEVKTSKLRFKNNRISTKTLMTQNPADYIKL